MGITLHHCAQTRSMRSLWLLHELGVDFQLVEHGFDKSLRAPEYLALNPAGRVPALEIDGRVVFETGAITQVLCARFPQAGLGRVEDDDDWQDWLIWLHFAETISQHSAALTQQHIALYDDGMRSPIVMKLEAARQGKCFAVLEQRLKTRDYLLDGGFSAADISVGQAVYMAKHFTRIAPFEALSDWYKRITSRAAFKESLPPAGTALLYPKKFYEVWHDEHS